MKLGFLYGKWSTAIHGPFDIHNLFVSRGLTGSESAFWNTIKSLAEKGHDVFASCPATSMQASRPPWLAGATVIPTSNAHDRPELPTDCDAYIAWNEPDLLRLVPPQALRVLNHQINDFRVFYNDWHKAVDLFVLVSESHRRHIIAEGAGKVPAERTYVIPNSIEPSFYKGPQPQRRPGSIAFTSSPDRGLFRMLDIFPEIRARVPHASLDIYYEWEKIYRVAKERSSLNSVRFKFMDAVLEKYGHKGENGITLHGFVSNVEIARRLRETEVFAYPCEPIRYTEGFSVGTLDACAAGCAVVISDADALPSIYGEAATVIYGKPAVRRQQWIDTIIRLLTDHEYAEASRAKTLPFSERYHRQLVANDWEFFLCAAAAIKPRKSS